MKYRDINYNKNAITGKITKLRFTCVALFTKVWSIIWRVTSAKSVVHAMAGTTTLNNAITWLPTNLTQQHLLANTFLISRCNRLFWQIAVTINLTCNRHCKWFSQWFTLLPLHAGSLLSVHRIYHQTYMISDLFHSFITHVSMRLGRCILFE